MLLASLPRALAVAACALSVGMATALAQSRLDTDRSGLTASYLESRQAVVEARKDIPPEAKAKLVSLYQRAIADVERAGLTREETARLREALRAAPLERRRLAKLLEEEEKTAGEPKALPDLATLSDDDLEHLEAAARADYDEAQLQVDRLEAERDLAVNRPYALAQEQDEARKALDQLRTQPLALAGADGGGAQSQAQQLATRARIMALQAELERLGAESAYLPAEQRILELRARSGTRPSAACGGAGQAPSAGRGVPPARRCGPRSCAGRSQRLAARTGPRSRRREREAQGAAGGTGPRADASRGLGVARTGGGDRRTQRCHSPGCANRTLRSEFVEALLDRLHSLPTGETFTRQRKARASSPPPPSRPICALPVRSRSWATSTPLPPWRCTLPACRRLTRRPCGPPSASS